MARRRPFSRDHAADMRLCQHGRRQPIVSSMQGGGARMAKSRKGRNHGNQPAAAQGRRFTLILVVFLAIAAVAGVVYFMPGRQTVPGPPAQVPGADVQALKGRWLRPDGGYILEIRNVSRRREDGGWLFQSETNPRVEGGGLEDRPDDECVCRAARHQLPGFHLHDDLRPARRCAEGDLLSGRDSGKLRDCLREDEVRSAWIRPDTDKLARLAGFGAGFRRVARHQAG